MAGEGEGPPQMVFGTQGQISQLLDGSILERFAGLDQGGKCAAEYVWLGGTMSDLRSKTKTLLKAPKSIDDLPDWNYDGSSTNQAPGTESAVGSDLDAGPSNYPILYLTKNGGPGSCNRLATELHNTLILKTSDALLPLFGTTAVLPTAQARARFRGEKANAEVSLQAMTVRCC